MRSLTAVRTRAGAAPGRARAVADLACEVVGGDDPGPALAHVARVAATSLGMTSGAVLEVDAAHGALRTRVAVTTGGGPAPPPNLPLADAGALARVLEHGEEVVALRASGLPVPLWDRGARVVAAVPVRGGDTEIDAMLLVAGPRARAPSRSDLAFLAALAALAGLARERGRQRTATQMRALRDSLTGLPNRALALDRLAAALARRERDTGDVAVLVVDVDRLKAVNAALGDRWGDALLRAVGARLVGALRPTDTVARLGGDEFLIVCDGVRGGAAAAAVARRAAGALETPFELAGDVRRVQVSIGLALAGGPGDTPESLLRDADAAVHMAKDRGGGRVEILDEEMRDGLRARARTEHGLRRALERDEFEVWHQPIVDLAGGAPMGTEALVRWRHPERGLVAPGEFIGVAEESGLIGPLGLRVLTAACRHAAGWQRALGLPLRVSVNMSARQLADPALADAVEGVMRTTGLRPGTLLLELTETVLAEGDGSVAPALAAVCARGCGIALDDFGTGHSSLGRLRSCPVDVLKIDRSFVAGLPGRAEDMAFVKAMIDMAHAIGLHVVAEGVETPDQRDVLTALGCDAAQGYLFARPMPAAAAFAHLAATVPCPSPPARIADARGRPMPRAGAAAPSVPLVATAALEALPDAVTITEARLDRPGPRILYVNRAFEEMTGYRREEVLGRTPRVLQGPGSDRDELDRLKAEVAASGRFRGRTVNYRRDGRPFIMEWAISRMRTDDGVECLVAVQRDITRFSPSPRRLAPWGRPA
ncbi:MAG TPA: EAL domain-containing protein [Miltoncostaeaceae bacterium]|nr:EAL domain-containing protein [Miltoncostaeaceae bacterium]